MKKIFLIFLLAYGFILTGCSQQKWLSQDKIFEKKQECIKYKINIEEEIDGKNTEKWFQESFYELDQIFYSPIKNSCLYSYKRVWLQNNLTIRSFLDYFIVDYLTKDMIFETNIWAENTESLKTYNEKIRELKWD